MCKDQVQCKERPNKLLFFGNFRKYASVSLEQQSVVTKRDSIRANQVTSSCPN